MSAKELIVVMGMMMASMLTALLSGAWAAAYANGGSIVIYIDKFGEANPELVMWILIYPIITLACYYVVEEYGN